MLKQNVIEPGRTPQLDKQADADQMEKQAIDTFKAQRGHCHQRTGHKCPECGCDPCMVR